MKILRIGGQIFGSIAVLMLPVMFLMYLQYGVYHGWMFDPAYFDTEMFLNDISSHVFGYTIKFLASIGPALKEMDIDGWVHNLLDTAMATGDVSDAIANSVFNMFNILFNAMYQVIYIICLPLGVIVCLLIDVIDSCSFIMQVITNFDSYFTTYNPLTYGTIV